MRGASRFILALVCGLALLTWAASLIVGHTIRGWFERDMQLRTQLAVAGAREPLVANWTSARRLQATLAEIARDERIMGAAGCGAGFELLAKTSEYPATASCAALGALVRQGEPERPLAVSLPVGLTT